MDGLASHAPGSAAQCLVGCFTEPLSITGAHHGEVYISPPRRNGGNGLSGRSLFERLTKAIETAGRQVVMRRDATKPPEALGKAASRNT